MEEIYKDIKGYEGKYQVSNLGNVKSCKKNKLLSIYKQDDGYVRVSLWKNNKGKTYYVHRLVAMAFIDNPNKLPEVNHKDENKNNNYVGNLEWCTSQYNMNYGNGAHKKSAENHRKPINQYDLQGDFIKSWNSGTEISKVTGYSHSNITRCCKNKVKTAYGFIWRYADKEVVL